MPELPHVFHFVDEGHSSPNPRSYQHELAACWFDRRLGLRLSPVTVPRKVDGRPGAAWASLESAIDTESIRQSQRWELLEGLEPQIEALLTHRDRILATCGDGNANAPSALSGHVSQLATCR